MDYGCCTALVELVDLGFYSKAVVRMRERESATIQRRHEFLHISTFKTASSLSSFNYNNPTLSNIIQTSSTTINFIIKNHLKNQHPSKRLHSTTSTCTPRPSADRPRITELAALSHSKTPPYCTIYLNNILYNVFHHPVTILSSLLFNLSLPIKTQSHVRHTNILPRPHCSGQALI